ncbi:sugar phosphate/phosphate translocator [Artemisia annua]|uniref:Sugar phosphate/phosphate translocator n=1 Tax=Artemisia annua TaxID=35608 RepID=A0A2U1LWN5_ARTAN|nr:sugar phosphate/phosphate translocator [Artemisia annua]
MGNAAELKKLKKLVCFGGGTCLWARKQIGLKNPMTLMSYVTHVTAMLTGLLSLAMDPWGELRTSSYFDSSGHIILSCFLLIFGRILAFFMVLTEYILVSVTSAVTVTMEAVTILANMPKEIAEYLNKIGARIPNIKPGKATVEYLGKIQASTRFWGISLSTIFSATISVIRHVCDD